jgi:aryl-alcohol dehydrogenase-like predicted oxidoreductase
LNGLIVDDKAEIHPDDASFSHKGNMGPVNTSTTAAQTTSATRVGQHNRQSSSVTAWKGRFDTPEAREAVRIMRREAQKLGVSVVSVGLRWLAYHSHLGEGDAILLGAKSAQNLEAKLVEIGRGPLPDDVVAAMAESGRRWK